mgnify:CR=1 FL=1
MGLAAMPIGAIEAGTEGTQESERMGFVAPVPGSYSLPDLGIARDGDLLDTHGNRLRLRSLFAGRSTLLSLIYARCSDTQGCPFATATLHRTAKALNSRLKHPDRVQFLTVSFQPEHDTPKVMKEYARPFEISGFDWKFLTPVSPEARDDMLEGYGQKIDALLNARGQRSGEIAHVLRVFLIDGEGRIRNSYSPSVLHRDLLLADLSTLEIAGKKAPEDSRGRVQAAFRAGDDKAAYDRSDYRTHSESLPHRQGQKIDLIREMKAARLGLPEQMPGQSGPLSEKIVQLGRKLFFDRRLSFNGTLSCALCHIPEQGFASQEQATSVGIEGRTVRRNAPTLLNVGFLSKLFLDGRENRLENQVWGPLLAHNEMGNPAIGLVLSRIENLRDYQGLFEAAFGRGPTLENLGSAIAQYERTLVAGTSPFDLWYYGKQDKAVSDEVRKGFALFTGRAGCSRCHALQKESSLFTDQAFHNTGTGEKTSPRSESKTRVQLAPGVFTELEEAQILSVSESGVSDLGLSLIHI